MCVCECVCICICVKKIFCGAIVKSEMHAQTIRNAMLLCLVYSSHKQFKYYTHNTHWVYLSFFLSFIRSLFYFYCTFIACVFMCIISSLVGFFPSLPVGAFALFSVWQNISLSNVFTQFVLCKAVASGYTPHFQFTEEIFLLWRRREERGTERLN